MANPSQQKELITLRISPQAATEIRRMAEAEGESQSLIIRRLLRLGLDSVERSGEGQ